MGHKYKSEGAKLVGEACKKQPRGLFYEICCLRRQVTEKKKARIAGFVDLACMVARGGIEPSTRGFSVPCSTN